MATIKVRARTVDMLGRQQIAGVPTAISELFKNAHDAYAKRVEIDYYRVDDLFVVRDDGLGMSPKDFEDRWLTLGTESKLDAGGIEPPGVDPDQPLRAILGEKGIGRLAIAAIGEQLVVLTRAKKQQGVTDVLVAAFLHWGVLALPGVDLAEILVPTAELPGGTLPTKDNIAELVKQFSDRVNAITKKLKIDGKSLLESLAKFEFDPQACTKFLPKGPSLEGVGHGTQFFIKPADATLRDDIKDPDDELRASPLTKALIGFSNTMTPNREPPAIVARFRDHLEDGATEERIGDASFFTPSEFESADHHFSGNFDKYGQFKGTITIYSKEVVPYVSSWPNISGEQTRCGPFRIDIAYVQGTARESRIPPEDHARLTAKLNRIGGLYIYRNGVRILPYGDSDYDFLDIERRRTKSAGYYYFSYRRMFGLVEITRDGNPNLVEKAGREGFRQNKAYRQFRDILEHFFIQLAADFFRKDAAHGAVFQETKDQLERDELLRRKREEETKHKRKEFSERLDSLFAEMEAKKPELEVASLFEKMESRLASLAKLKDKTEAVTQTLQCESECKIKLEQIKEQFRLAKPRGWGLNKTLQRDWAAFQAEASRLDAEIFAPAQKRLASLVQETTDKIGVEIENKVIARSSLESRQKAGTKRLRALEGVVRTSANELRDRTVQQAQQALARAQRGIEEALVDFESAEIDENDKAGFEQSRVKWEARIAETIETEASELERLRDELKTVGTEASRDAMEVTRILEEEVDDLRERDLAHLELVQVGMALGIIHHEFRGCVKSLRKSLQSLKRWADSNKGLQSLYSDIRGSFDHLDGYLTLFTPLTRRLHRTKIDVTGSAIAHFLDDLFGERLKRHDVKMIATDAFKAHSIHAFPSSIYPCFVNLVDNAIFWLSDWKGRREITLDASSDGFSVTDSGPGIKPRDSEVAFDLGFTRKPGGQGMGLYVSRRTLQQIGYDLALEPYEKGAGARFLISRLPEKKD